MPQPFEPVPPWTWVSQRNSFVFGGTELYQCEGLWYLYTRLTEESERVFDSPQQVMQDVLDGKYC